MKKILIIVGILIFFISFLFLGQLTNPYGNPNLISRTFYATVDTHGDIVLEQKEQVHFTTNWFAKKFAEINKASRFIVSTAFPEKPLHGNEQEIIAQIHQKSFNPTKPYVISGTHFSDIYVRNLGIFYNAALDTRVGSKEDFLNRQKIMLQGVVLNLELLKQSGKEYTTFMPILGSFYTATNVYTEPSDSLFGVLFALAALRDETFIHKLYPANTKQTSPLQTKKTAEILLKKYKPTLQLAIINYQNELVDSKTRLIKKDITLSSARDGIKRQSAFYDNVILWSTINMAQNMGILEKRQDMKTWKEKIISAFWDEKTGIFLDDLSEESKKQKLFSGDAFIVTGSGFFDLTQNEDKKKLRRMVTYVETNKLDQPFPLFYAKKDQPENLYWAVATFAPSYMGETIWSHWGIEYIKALVLLSPDESKFLKTANKHLTSYKKNIESTGGYPELYDKSGNLYVTPLYRSILHTSWVINYEQALMLLNDSHSQ